MRLVFLGHQSWLVQVGASALLIDPLLGQRVDNSFPGGIPLYPAHTVDPARFPRLDAVLLTHEHPDHVNLASLDRLPRSVPILVGALMLDCVVNAVEQLGFRVRRVPSLERVCWQDLTLTLYPAGGDGVDFSERRVVQPLVEAADGSSRVLMTVDAPLSPRFQRDVDAGRQAAPDVLVFSNNCQFTRAARIGALQDPPPLEYPTDLPEEQAMIGLWMLQAVLGEAVRGLPGLRDLVIGGGGFVKNSRADTLGAFPPCSQQELVAMAAPLAAGREPRVHAPQPGDCLTLGPDGPGRSRLDWVEIDAQATVALDRLRDDFLAAPSPAEAVPMAGGFSSDDDARVALARAERELPQLAQAIMLSPIAGAAMAMHEYRGRPLGPRRLLLSFVGGPRGARVSYALDLVRAEFSPDHTPADDAVARFPFGLELFLSDFTAVLEGRLHIWDLVSTSMRGWYAGDTSTNLEAFLLRHYGDQVRPDLLARTYRRRLRALLGEPAREAARMRDIER